MYGGMTVSADGKTIHYVWDYAKDEPVDKKLMTKARQRASDIAYAKLLKEQLEDESRRLDTTRIEDQASE
jgi:hypothetical protein